MDRSSRGVPVNYTSIIIASYIPDEERLEMFERSLKSLFETCKDLPVEVIVIDNGGSFQCSDMLKTYVDLGKIQTLITNSNNMHFGLARNQGIHMAAGDYFCIADNDILYMDGWLEACLRPLQMYPEKALYATPIAYPASTAGKKTRKYLQGELDVDGEKYELDMRAGSNCFVIHRADFFNIGYFKNHRIAGSLWTDEAVRKGYLAAVTPTQLVADMGLRKGYNLKQPIPICRTLLNGEKVYFNHDEFKE